VRRILLEICINIDIYTYITIHLYKYTYVQSISISTSEILSQFDLKIHKVGHQECIAVDEDVSFY
jgi:hypothetical protein